MRLLLLPLLSTALAAQLAPPATPGEPSLSPAPAVLASKAPGQPPYGLKVTTPEGMFLLTHLRYDPASPTGRVAAYRMAGPATWGAYRLGMTLVPKWDTYGLDEDEGVNGPATSGYTITHVERGGPADAAGLDATWMILQIDGRDFNLHIPEFIRTAEGPLHWMPKSQFTNHPIDSTLFSYATHRPTLDVLARKLSGWGKGKEKHFQIQLQKQEAPVDPSDAEVFDSTNFEQVLQMLRPQLMRPTLWQALARFRSNTPRFRPIPVKLIGQPWWVVRGDPTPSMQHAIGRDIRGQVRWMIRDKVPLVPGVAENQDRVFLEFWKENPAGDNAGAAPVFLCAEPSDHVLKDRILRLQDRWFRVADAAFEPADGRLAKLEIQPWEPDIDSLLGGAMVGPDLGAGAALTDWASVEQLANDALVEWKTRKLPAILANETAAAAEDLVVRIEKGVLGLDLKARNLRTRLDAASREEAERKAQAELAARQGKPAQRLQPFPAAEVEQIASLLDQRKTILMAILGSAKQALANLRR